MSAVDWEALRNAARSVAANAYAPYSGLCVGAAAVADDGSIVTGCNVENASYGLSFCAECSVVAHLFTGGGRRLVALACVSASGASLLPCGRCRQILHEVGGPGMLVDSPSGPRPLGDLLPDAFGPGDLPT